MYVTLAAGYMTKQRAQPIWVSQQAPNGKMFPKISPAPYAALAKICFPKNNYFGIFWYLLVSFRIIN